jgi:hypothetical protein
MEDKVIVLSKDGQWWELESCFLVGAVESPDKVVYYKFLLSKCEEETRNEMLKKAEQFLIEQQKGRK